MVASVSREVGCEGDGRGGQVGLTNTSDKDAGDGVYYVGWWPWKRVDFVGGGGAGEWTGGWTGRGPG